MKKSGDCVETNQKDASYTHNTAATTTTAAASKGRTAINMSETWNWNLSLFLPI